MFVMKLAFDSQETTLFKILTKNPSKQVIFIPFKILHNPILKMNLLKGKIDLINFLFTLFRILCELVKKGHKIEKYKIEQDM